MTYRIRRQAGGTALGLIIGLIIGLGIAVAVAVTITKAPVPLSNRMARPDKPAFDPSAAVDPNKPLYGKRSTPSAAPPAASPAPASAAPVAAEESAPANTVVQTQPATEVVPIVEKSIVPAAIRSPSAATSADKEAPAANGDDKYTYYLQAGAFRERADADNTRAKLALLGFEARISERLSDNGTLYRVRIGPVAQMDAINRMRSELSDGGVDAAVVRVAK